MLHVFFKSLTVVPSCSYWRVRHWQLSKCLVDFMKDAYMVSNFLQETSIIFSICTSFPLDQSVTLERSSLIYLGTCESKGWEVVMGAETWSVSLDACILEAEEMDWWLCINLAYSSDFLDGSSPLFPAVLRDPQVRACLGQFLMKLNLCLPSD